VSEADPETLEQMLSPCRLCPRVCGADRLGEKAGFCSVGRLARVASAGAHFGEEPILVGPGGSGTIFFQGCNLDCVFCQNHEISHRPGGVEVSADQLAGLMTDLQKRSCSNVNLVTPTHVAAQIVEALVRARRKGLALPVVYNCGGYESVEVLRLLAGHVDVYMPDFKYASADAGLKYSGVPDYPTVARAALAEMYRQVGLIALDERRLAVRGVLVRHLVLPADLADSAAVIDAVAETAPGSAMNVMGQYRPAYRAGEFPELLAVPRAERVAELRRLAAARGLAPVS